MYKLLDTLYQGFDGAPALLGYGIRTGIEVSIPAFVWPGAMRMGRGEGVQGPLSSSCSLSQCCGRSPWRAICRKTAAIVAIIFLAGEAQPEDQQHLAAIGLEDPKEQAVAIGQTQPLEPSLAPQRTREGKASSLTADAAGNSVGRVPA